MLLRLLPLLCFSAIFANFTVSPLFLELECGQEQPINQTIRVQNGEERPITLALYLHDFDTLPSGQEQELSQSSNLRSCKEWITLSPEGPFTLEPGEEKLIRLSLSPEMTSPGLFWTKLYVAEQSRPPPVRQSDGQMHMKIFIKQRWEVRVHANVVDNITQDATIAAMEKQGSILSVDVENLGNSFLRCQGSLEIRNMLGDIVVSIDLGTDGHFSLYPEVLKRLSASLPPLERGEYVALALIDFDEEELIAGELAFSVD